MEKGINIITNSQTVSVDGAEELIEKWKNGEITSREELTQKLMDLEVIYTDITKDRFKEAKE
jgi:hypothetical protein